VHLFGYFHVRVCITMHSSENASSLNTTFLTKCRVGKFRAISVNNDGAAKSGYICIFFNDAVTKSDNAASNKWMLWNNNLDVTWKYRCMA
jgi:hypothetical protein